MLKNNQYCEGQVLTKGKGAKVFYLKMIEDYYRYTAESATGDQLTAVTENMLKNYNEATQATAPLKPYSFTKLGLALNLSVFYYKFKDKSSKACAIVEEFWMVPRIRSMRLIMKRPEMPFPYWASEEEPGSMEKRRGWWK